MKIVKLGLVAGALVAAAGMASAQPNAQARGPAAEVTRDQALARADQRFQRLDANRDGRITAEELRQVAQARMAQRQERRTARQGQMFDRLDADRNGQISREEFSQRRELRGERRERRGMRGQRGGRGGAMAMRGMGQRMLGADGVLTAEEFRAQALRRFEMLDSNRDGRITADERRGARQRLRAGRRGAPTPPTQD